MANHQPDQTTMNVLFEELQSRGINLLPLVPDVQLGDLFEELESRGFKLRATTNVQPQVTLQQMSDEELLDIAQSRHRLIYGIDNRRDIFQVTDPAILSNVDGVVALFDQGRIRDNLDGTSTILTGNYTQVNVTQPNGSTTWEPLCTSEPFYDQPNGSFCTGFLVANNIIATAGHCVDPANVALASVRIVFGFEMINGTQARTIIPNDEIYQATAIIDIQNVNPGADWALVRLDRSVNNHRILPIRRRGRIADQEPLYIIGHPKGLPKKVSDDAIVGNNEPAEYFITNLDAFAGNSGSPVINSQTHIVEGILVRGPEEFHASGGCYVSIIYNDDTYRTHVTRATEFANQVPPNPRCAQIQATIAQLSVQLENLVIPASSEPPFHKPIILNPGKVANIRARIQALREEAGRLSC